MDFEDNSIDISNSYKTSDQRLINGFKSVFKNYRNYENALSCNIIGRGETFEINLTPENAITIYVTSLNPNRYPEVIDFLSNENFEKHESLQFFEELLYDIFLPKIIDKLILDVDVNAIFKKYINLIKNIAHEHEYRHTYIGAFDMSLRSAFSVSMFYKNMTISFSFQSDVRNDIKNKIDCIYKDIAERRIIINYAYGVRTLFNGLHLFDVLDLSYDIEDGGAGYFKIIKLKFHDIFTRYNEQHTISMSYDKYTEYLNFLKKYDHISELDYETRRLEYEIITS